MKYQYRVSKKMLGYGKSYRVNHLDENYKILKQTYFKFVRRYDIVHSCIKYEGICWGYKLYQREEYESMFYH